jgi:membrane protein YdbS with pleckstrin-like domain
VEVVTPLDPRFIAMQRELGWYWTAALSIVVLLSSLVVLTPRRWYWCVLIWVVATPLLGWWSYRWAEVEYRHRAYAIDDDGIEIKAGVFWKGVSNVPRSRVQHTDVAQGPLERKYGLGRLIIYTAGTHHSRVELPGLEHQTAFALRDHLLPRQTADVI